jgi:beta-lactamase superfamily II metal-dependent hydrolase
MARTRQLIAALWLALGSAAPLAAQQPVTYVVRASTHPCARVRLQPSTDAPIRTCVPPGTVLVEIGVAPFWREVRLPNGDEGWVAKQYLEPAAAPPADTLAPAVTPGAHRDDAWLEVHVVDVGQGDGIWIHTFDDGQAGNGWYEGRNIVIDGGPDASDDKNEMLHYLLRAAHEGATIDALIVTHPHDDHYPGALGVLRHFEVRDYYDPGYPKDGQKYADFLTAVRAESAGGQPIVQHIGRAHLGKPDWGRELDVRFLYAYPGAATGLGSGNTLENNASIVMRIVYGDVSLLFMGDAEGKDRDDGPDSAKYAERLLLADPGPAGLKSTVLKIAHHGSETSSTLPFIRAVDPRYVIVSSGRKSFNGRFLPDASTLQRYCDHNPAIRIYRTDQDDAAEHRTTTNDADGDHIVIRTNGTAVLVDALSAGTHVTPTACSAH